jgi:dihydropyrimidine dehydrogenase (NAD+) subunit PreA
MSRRPLWPSLWDNPSKYKNIMKRNTPDLSVSFIGQSLRTPFLIASGPQTTVIGNIQKYVPSIAKYGWSGVVAKTVTLGRSLHVRPYLWSTNEYRFQALQNSGSRLISWDGQTLERLKRDVETAHHHGLMILGSITGSTTQEWQTLASYMQEARVDGIELDVSCPSEARFTAEKMSSFLGNVEQKHAEQVIFDIRKVFQGPIVAKLSFHTYDIGNLAKACQSAGAAALSAINTIQGVIGVDVNSGIPICSGYQKNSYRSGISGPIIKPFGLSAVSKISSATHLPVSGLGGIADWKSAVEYIMVGATTVQVCTAAMWQGFKLGQVLTNGLKKFMIQKGYKSLQEFRGISLPYFTSAVPIPRTIKASIDIKRCKRCGRCLIACRDGAYDAIEKRKGLFQVNHGVCDGCGLCVQVCPEQVIQLEVSPEIDCVV